MPEASRGRSAGARARRPAAGALPAADRRGRAAQRRGALGPPRSRGLADRRRERAVGAGVPDALEPRRRGPDPPAERPQRPLRAGWAWVAIVAAVAPMERLQGAPRRRHPRRRSARRNGVAVRVHRRRDRRSRAPSRERVHHHPRPRLLPRRPRRARRRLRGAAGAEPGAQRVRALPPLRRLDRHRALLGAHRAPRPPQPRRRRRSSGNRIGLARLGAGDPDGQRRLALAAVAAGPGDRRAPLVARRRRALRLRRHTGVRVGGRHQPQPAARVALVRDREHPGPIRLPAADLPRRRLDRALHRRSAVPRLGARHADLGADGQGRAPLRARRLRRHGQRDRAVPRADPGRARARAARVVHA